MKFVYPIEVVPGTDQIMVVDDDGRRYKEVKAVYRMGEKVVIETPNEMIQCDPGQKVQVLTRPS